MIVNFTHKKQGVCEYLHKHLELTIYNQLCGRVFYNSIYLLQDGLMHATLFIFLPIVKSFPKMIRQRLSQINVL